ncbi:MAG: host attachment protein [Campylobacterales bacterium]|nr:host attachment protein [Campylobacterales bacterium]
MKLENTIVIVADLGELKAYNVEKHEGMVGNELKISHSLKLINDENFISGRKKINEVVSDSAGRFHQGTLENHNLKEERENRTVKDIAHDIDAIVNEMKPAQLFLAFPKEHSHELENELSQATKAVLTKNVASDLVKTDKDKILSHFA